MGTLLRIHLDGSPRAIEAALREVERIERACSTWEAGSAWSRLNGARGEAAPMEAEWISLLGQALVLSDRTGGAFDPVIRPLLEAWGVRSGGREATETEWRGALAASGARLLQLDPRAGTARLLDPRAGVDEGGFLKGHALDAARREAQRRGANSGWMDFGGQLIAWGRPLPVQVADPSDRGRARVALQLRDASLSTSGCSERGRHLLDPRSGRPCDAWGSVSVVAPSALEADILSTALYVLGPEAGLAWAERHALPALFQFPDRRHRASSAFDSLNPTFLPGDRK